MLFRSYSAYKRRKNHGYFLAQFARHVERFELSRSATNVERAVALWKNYLASLENSALNSFTPAKSWPTSKTIPTCASRWVPPTR